LSNGNHSKLHWFWLPVLAGVIMALAVAATLVGILYEPWALGIGLAANLIIAVDYLLIGAFIAPKFSIAGPYVGAQVARLAGLAFFITCAMTHTELFLHGLTEGVAERGEHEGVGEWFVSSHGLVAHNFQAAAGFIFFLFAYRYLGVLIVDRDTYRRVVDERLQQYLKRQKQAAVLPNPAPDTEGNIPHE
jgi:hypothetical protein